PMEATLLGLQAPISGRIESITGGISAANAASSTQGLSNVDPIFTWVRLAQRIPVRIRIEQVPPEVSLVAGMTCKPPLPEAALYICILASLIERDQEAHVAAQPVQLGNDELRLLLLGHIRSPIEASSRTSV